MGTLQENNPKQVWSHLLYVRINGSDWEQLAYWALMGKSEPGCLPEIRLTRASPTMLQMQYKLGRAGGDILREVVEREGKGVYKKPRSRPASDR